MPTTVIIDGEEKEVFTTEELESQKQEVIEKFKSENPDRANEIQTLQNALKETEEELVKYKDKDLNFSNLRKEKEQLEKNLKDITGNIDIKIESAKREIMEGVLKDHYSGTLSRLSSGDKELEKKIEYHYKRISDPSSTKDEIEKKLQDAFILAGGVKSPNNNGVFSSAGAGKFNLEPKAPLTDEQKEVLGKLAGSVGLKIDDKNINQ